MVQTLELPAVEDVVSIHVRCPRCLDYAVVAPGSDANRVLCPGCSRAMRLDSVPPDRRFHPLFSAQARELCRLEQIDLASAYSVLLGLMTLADAASVMQQCGGRFDSNRFDRGFRNAVRSGQLTVDQACARGDRLVFASRLIQERDLSIEEALRVADRAPAGQRGDRDTSRGSRQFIVGRQSPKNLRATAFYGLAFAMLLILGVVFRVWAVAGSSRGAEQGAPGRAHVGSRERPVNRLIRAVHESTEVRADAQGRATLIEGPSAEAVLTMFCRTEPGIVEPLRTQVNDGEAVGFFRRGERAYSISIAQERPEGRWKVGDGVNPVASLARER